VQNTSEVACVPAGNWFPVPLPRYHWLTLTWYETVFGWLTKHISWRYMLGIFVVSGVLLFFSSRLGIEDWERPYRPWLIVAFIFSGVVVLSYIGSHAYPWIAAYAYDTRTIHIATKHLHQLTADEKKFCKHFLDGNGVLTHNFANGAISNLVAKGILIKGSQPWPHGLHDFTMQPWALEYLKNHPELL